MMSEPNILTVLSDLGRSRVDVSEATRVIAADLATHLYSAELASEAIARSVQARQITDQAGQTLLRSLEAATRVLGGPSRDDDATVVLPVITPGPGSESDAATVIHPPAAAAAGQGRPVASAERSRSAPSEQDTLIQPPPIGIAGGRADGGGSAPLGVIKGRFELQKKIGAGGMGIVYSAIDRIKADAGDPNHWVAIKVLNADLREHFVALQREASKSQLLAHPNIATVYDFDKDGDTAFVAMELLKGQSLDRYIQGLNGRGLDRRQAFPIILGIAEGLAYAHKRGIVHCDLKPANIFLLEDGTAKLLDFGIARSIASPAGEANRDSYDAGDLGAYTPAYATQEMIEGADAAACDDLYALGLVIYELLSGHHPYQRESAPVARERKRVATPLKGLSRGEWKVVASTLRFSRAERPKDAGEFLRLLNRDGLRRKTLFAVVAVAAIAIGGLEYRDYRNSGPAIAYEDLPPETKTQVHDALEYGDKAWTFFEQQGIADGAMTAVDAYESAYRLHPRNRQAARGLARAADAILKMTAQDHELQVQAAQTLASKSDYLAHYSPVVAIIGSHSK